MKQSHKTMFGVLGISALALGSIAYGANAYRGDYTQKGPEFSQERHEQMTSAFENNDYNAWSNLMGDRGRVKEVVTEENSNKFSEAHKLASEGKYGEADSIREELGLRTRDGEPRGAGYGQGKNRNGDGESRKGNGQKGQNAGGNFIDSDGDGSCDNMN
jgi:hypothetical protein